MQSMKGEAYFTGTNIALNQVSQIEKIYDLFEIIHKNYLQKDADFHICQVL